MHRENKSDKSSCRVKTTQRMRYLGWRHYGLWKIYGAWQGNIAVVPLHPLHRAEALLNL